MCGVDTLSGILLYRYARSHNLGFRTIALGTPLGSAGLPGPTRKLSLIKLLRTPVQIVTRFGGVLGEAARGGLSRWTARSVLPRSSAAMRTHDLARDRACTTDTLIPVCLTGHRFSFFIMIYDRVL